MERNGAVLLSLSIEVFKVIDHRWNFREKVKFIFLHSSYVLQNNFQPFLLLVLLITIFSRSRGSSIFEIQPLHTFNRTTGILSRLWHRSKHLIWLSTSPFYFWDWFSSNICNFNPLYNTTENEAISRIELIYYTFLWTTIWRKGTHSTLFLHFHVSQY